MNVSEYIREKCRKENCLHDFSFSISNRTQLDLVSAGYKNKITYSMGNLENRNLILYNGSKGLKFKVSMSMWMALFLSNRNLTVFTW